MIKKLILKLKKLSLNFFNDRCECGELKKCPRKIKVHNNGSFEVEGHYKCIKIQKFNKKLNKMKIWKS